MLTLLRKELRLELRSRETLVGVVMYMVSTVYVCYLNFKELDAVATWNALLWIIVLFTAFQAMARTFRHEPPRVQLYLYTLVSPEQLILAKLVFNALFMGVLSLLALGCLVLFLGDAVLSAANMGAFVTGLVVGAMALGAGLTLISGIAVKTGNNVGLTAVLAFPVLIPVLLVLRDITFSALQGQAFAEIVGKLGLLGGITVLILGLSYLLFPYLWRE